MQKSAFLISPNARIYLPSGIPINYIAEMQLENYKIRILDLAQRWQMNLLNEAERNELEAWFRSLEDCNLGVPTKMSLINLKSGCINYFEIHLKSRMIAKDHHILSSKCYLPLSNSFFSFSGCNSRSSKATFSSYNSTIFQ